MSCVTEHLSLGRSIEPGGQRTDHNRLNSSQYRKLSFVQHCGSDSLNKSICVPICVLVF